MKKLILIITCLIPLLALSQETGIIPRPQQIDYHEGTFYWSKNESKNQKRIKTKIVKEIPAKGTKLTVYASDTEISIKKTINAEIIEEGSILLPGRFIGEYMRKLSDQQIELFTNEKNQLRIKYGDSEGFVQVLDKNEYPFDEQEKGDYKVTINQKDLKDAIEKTIFSVAQDDTRPVLKGCLMEFEGRRMTVVALDGYRLALVKKPLTQEAEKKNIIVPARSLYEASRLMESQEDEAEMFVTDKHVVFDIKDTEVTARLINGEFVNYRQILPDNYVSNVVINKKQFEESLDRASVRKKTIW